MATYQTNQSNIDALKAYLAENGPQTAEEIEVGLKWHRGRVNKTITAAQPNCISFKRVVKSCNSVPFAVYSFSGKHIGGICAKCGKKTYLLPVADFHSKNAKCRTPDPFCRTCKQEGWMERGAYRFKDPILGPPISDPNPLDCQPGSEERIQALSARVGQGMQLWNGRDKKVHDDKFGWKVEA